MFFRQKHFFQLNDKLPNHAFQQTQKGAPLKATLCIHGIFTLKEVALREAKNIQQKETVDLLNKCWMTHDGMWFFHCLQEFGIEVTNKLNKSAIKSLSSIEIVKNKKNVGLHYAN